jgi:NAD(P)-dependent dehydrogenase (short-subunit alcohol dehydrogenase family)
VITTSASRPSIRIRFRPKAPQSVASFRRFEAQGKAAARLTLRRSPSQMALTQTIVLRGSAMSEVMDRAGLKMGQLFDLTGKVAVITGSSRGIGKAIAERMAEHGAKVVISSRKAGPCEEVAAEINAKSPGHAIAVPANISSKEDLQRLVEETRKAFGKIDILVCNAASNPFYGSQLDISDDAFRKILENNIIANNWLVQLVAPEMRERKDGAIVVVSSIGGLRGSTVIGAYCISKAADMQLARNLAQELGPDNIRVNCIAPGLVKTDFARALWDTPEGEKRASSGTPLRRLGEPDDIAGAAVFLASKAGSWMTGQTVVIDGGSTC